MTQGQPEPVKAGTSTLVKHSEIKHYLKEWIMGKSVCVCVSAWERGTNKCVYQCETTLALHMLQCGNNIVVT